MMRKMFSVALMAFAFGLVQSANAGVTIDVVFQDATSPTGITIYAAPTASQLGLTGPGCDFGGYADGSVATGYCMDVILTSDHNFIGMGTSVGYDSDNGLAIGSMYEWRGAIVGWSRGAPSAVCAPPGGLKDTGTRIESFDCIIPPPVPPPSVAAGSYKIGTIVWDTSGTTSGTEVVAAVINDLINGMSLVINGNGVFFGSADIVQGTHILTIIPEPGTASLLGLGLVGLILAGRRSRA
jgi:hypothetical protein